MDIPYTLSVRLTYGADVGKSHCDTCKVGHLCCYLPR